MQGVNILEACKSENIKLLVYSSLENTTKLSGIPVAHFDSKGIVEEKIQVGAIRGPFNKFVSFNHSCTVLVYHIFTPISVQSCSYVNHSTHFIGPDMPFQNSGVKFVSLRTIQFIEMFMAAFLHKVGDNKIGVGKLQTWFCMSACTGYVYITKYSSYTCFHIIT